MTGVFFLKKDIFFGGSKERMLDYFYSISKQGIKVFLGGGGRRKRGQRQSFEGHKKIGINREHMKTIGEEGDKSIYFRETREQTTSFL